MPSNNPPPDARPASPPLHQSMWFPVAPEAGPESSQDEPVAASPPPLPAPPSVNGLGWKAPRRVHVPVFERDAAQENTTPTAPAAGPRVPTANDETVRQLREHIVPDPMPPDHVDDQDSATTIAHADAIEHDRMARLHEPPDDPDFQEVASSPSEHERREAAGSGSRDDATPNDGVVPPGLDMGSDDRFCCALWSDGTFSIRPSDGEPLVLTADDARSLLRYVLETLSARARAAA